MIHNPGIHPECRLLGKHWHHLPVVEITRLLETNVDSGLDLFEIQHRQERFGPNRILSKGGRSRLARFLTQFNNPLIDILLHSVISFMVIELEK